MTGCYLQSVLAPKLSDVVRRLGGFEGVGLPLL